MLNKKIGVVILLLLIILIAGCKKPICGNNIIEEGETAQTCCQDTGCLSEQTCQNNTCQEPVCGDCQYLENHQCVSYRCCQDSDCYTDQYCQNHQCIGLLCGPCQYASNHECKRYACCSDEDCDDNNPSTNNQCVFAESTLSYCKHSPIQTPPPSSVPALTTFQSSCDNGECDFGFECVNNICLKDPTSSCIPLKTNSNNGIDIVFTSEFYDEDEMYAFVQAADTYINYILDEEPYKSYANKFNFYYYGTPTDFGCYEPAMTKPKAIIAFSNNENCFHKDLVDENYNVIGEDPNRAINYLKNKGCPVDRVFVIINKPLIYGASVFDQGMITAPSVSARVVIHELAHSLTTISTKTYGAKTYLLDEYPLFLDDLFVKSEEQLEYYTFAENVDVIGCPKWCSGEINTNQGCYDKYIEVLNCVEPIQTTGNCMDSISFDTLLGCNVGIDCLEGTGCFPITINTLNQFHPTSSVINQYNGIMNTGDKFGPIAKQVLIEHIERLSD